MTLNELIFDTLETFESIYIDYGNHTKKLSNGLYEALEDEEVLNWYLDIIDKKPCMVINLDF